MQHPFTLDFDDEGLLERVAVPWMEGEGEEAALVREALAFALVDGQVYVPAQPTDAETSAFRDVASHSRFVHERVAGATGWHGLAPPLRTARETISVEAGPIAITRTVLRHPIHPVPVVRIELTNTGASTQEVSVHWCLGALNGYMPFSEKGDLPADLRSLLGGHISLFLLRIARVQRAENRAPAWAFVQLAATLAPGERASLDIQLWCVRHPWIGTQFSGVAYLARSDDQRTAIATTAATAGRLGDAVSFLLGRHYSPLFLLDRGVSATSLASVIDRIPLRLLLTNVLLDPVALDFFAERGIEVANFQARGRDPFLAIQAELDERLDVQGVPAVLHVLPRDLQQQLYFAHYFSLRQLPASIGRYTAPLRNLFVNAESLSDGFELPPNVVLVRALGSESEIPERDLEPLRARAEVRRHQLEEDVFGELSTYFAFHDYTRSRLALASTTDGDLSLITGFMDALERDTGERSFWDASLAAVARYGKPAAFGPPLSVIASHDATSPEGLATAAVAAQHAKSLRAVLHLVPEPPAQEKQWLLARADDVAHRVADLTAGGLLSEEIKGMLKAIHDRLSQCFTKSQRQILNLGEYSSSARYMFGQLGVYWFLSDARLPVEYLQVEDPFGRMLSLGCRTLNARMSLDTPSATAAFTALSVARFNGRGRPQHVVIAADPTGELTGAAYEARTASGILDMLGIEHVVLGPESIPCETHAFLALIDNTTVIHYSGHGEVVDGDPYLILADRPLHVAEVRNLRGEPVVLLNACELGRVAGDVGTQSVLSLLAAGASLVIAPLVAVADELASGYAALYGEFGALPFAAGVHFRRETVFLRHGDRVTDHLVYAIYGDPFLPRGDDIWEAFEASQLSMIGTIEGFKRTRESIDIRERAVVLYRIAAAELPLHPRLRGSPVAGSLEQTWLSLAHSSEGWRKREIADTLPSGPERSELLRAAAIEYRAAARLMERTFNETLNAGYAFHVEGEAEAEDAARAFLEGRIERRELDARFARAAGIIGQAIARFESIAAVGDLADCRKLVRRFGDPAALLHSPRALL